MILIFKRTSLEQVLMTIFNPQGLEYYAMPLDQGQNAEFVFSGITINQGASDFSDLQLDVEVVRGATTVFSGSSPTTVGEAGTTDSLSTGTTTTFTPADMGPHNMTFSFSATEEDTYTENDELTDQMQVTEFTYARHNGEVEVGGISNFTGNTGSFAIGDELHIFADAGITEMSIRIGNDMDQVSNLMYGQIYLWDGSNYVYLDQTPDHTITAGDNDDWVTLEFEDPVLVFEGQEILALASVYEGGVVTFQMAQPTTQGTVVGISGDGSFGNLIDPGAVMIDLTVLPDEYLNVDEVETNFSISQNFPNPFGSSAVINYELNEASNVSVEIVDVTGKVVTTINNGTQAAGAYTLNLDAADYANGVYFYTFTVGAEKVTKRMVVKK